MKVKKLLILTLILSLIMSSMSACVKEDSVSESKNKKESISDEKKTTEKDDKEESEESKTSDEESESKGGETDSDASSDNAAVDSSDTVAPGDGNTETTTTKKPTTTTAETTKKPTSTTTAETTTKKPASTTTAQTTTKKQSSTSTTDYGPIINQCSYDINDYSRRGVSDKAKAQAVTVLNSILKTSMTEVERVRAIHDWMVKNINYNYSAAADINNAPASALSAEGALVNKNVVCEGYSEAFMTLCWTAGIEARLVTGDANDGSGSIGHEWNVVKVDGKWYQIDVTWDDPAVNGVQNDPNGSNLRYEYFLITTADMTKDHIIEEYFNAGNISCTSKDFYTTVDTWAIKKMIGDVPYTKITSYAQGNTAAQNYFKQGITKFALIYTEGTMDYNTIVNNVKAEYGAYLSSDAASHPSGYKGYSYSINVSSKNDRGYTIDLLTSTLTYTY